jgi:REP element-mobilizing transposase RayT
MTECEAEVLRVCTDFCTATNAWCILPNHYHVLVRAKRITEVLDGLWQFHGRSSYTWSGEEDQRGRKVWYNCFERRMRSERQF